MFKKSLVLFTTIALSTITTFPAKGSTIDTKDIAIVEDNSRYTEIKSVVTDVVSSSIQIIEDEVTEVVEKTPIEVVSMEEEEQEVVEEASTYESKRSVASNVFSMESTAYTGGTFTATGTTPRRDPSGLSTVAVDPNVIPLGSLLYIDGYGYAVAEDTGGVIKGNIVDVYLNSYEECILWGRRHITVNLIAYPGEW